MGSSTAADVAPEVDRLVLAVNDSVDGERLAEAAGDRPVDWMVVSQFGDFLLAGALTRDIATARSPYRPPELVRGRLHDQVQQGLVEHQGKGLAATEEFRPLIETMLQARADVAATMWRGHEDDVEQASRIAHELAAQASDDHAVAVAHRGLPAPENPFLRLHSRLITLRYVRQHDHVAAWSARGLSAAGIAVMTALWEGADVPPGEAVSQLVDRGLATDDPPALTDEGRTMREEIEADTNERSQTIFTALGEDETAAFLAALRRLPG